MNKNVELLFRQNHQSIIDTFLSIEGKSKAIITKDRWKRSEGGGGVTFVIQDGKFFDNCAVNFSSIKGRSLPNSALGNKMIQSSKYGFHAIGISVIAHPRNPYVPSSHMNIRLFCTLTKNKQIKDWWSGGGYDLTPYFGFKDDCVKWHSSAKKTLDKYDKRLYKKFSKNCNEYFFLPHRNERRGIGGIFFDNFKRKTLGETSDMLMSVANQYKESYLKIVNNRNKLKYGKNEKEFQKIRRGRYVEFNLLNDRGTAFGLQSKGRTESILASLPIEAKWIYSKNEYVTKNERKLLKFFNKNWND